MRLLTLGWVVMRENRTDYRVIESARVISCFTLTRERPGVELMSLHILFQMSKLTSRPVVAGSDVVSADELMTFPVGSLAQ